jgi:anti-anti-sigma regulatory factor
MSAALRRSRSEDPTDLDDWRRSRRARHRDYGTIWVVKLSGEADLATRALLRRELAAAVRMDRDLVVLDVAGLRFCDVGCAELILAAGRRTSVSLAAAKGAVKRVFELLDPHETVPRYRAIQGTTLTR